MNLGPQKGHSKLPTNLIYQKKTSQMKATKNSMKRKSNAVLRVLQKMIWHLKTNVIFVLLYQILVVVHFDQLFGCMHTKADQSFIFCHFQTQSSLQMFFFLFFFFCMKRRKKIIKAGWYPNADCFPEGAPNFQVFLVNLFLCSMCNLLQRLFS